MTWGRQARLENDEDLPLPGRRPGVHQQRYFLGSRSPPPPLSRCPPARSQERPWRRASRPLKGLCFQTVPLWPNRGVDDPPTRQGRASAVAVVAEGYLPFCTEFGPMEPGK